MKTLYMASSGPGDPTRASIPLHLAVNGSLEVATTVENFSTEPMPLSLAYHPYFKLTGTPRDEWKLRLPAREQVVLSEKLVPTGERKPMALQSPYPLAVAFDSSLDGSIQQVLSLGLWHGLSLRGDIWFQRVERADARPGG